ncbi:MAG: DoxX family membrane protein [Candidatus Binataceae bacterium]
MNRSKLPALDATLVLALLRVALGVFFLSTFFENLGKDLYTAGGYASLIQYYIKDGHAPAVWKQVMGFTAGHAAIAAPMQGVLEAGLGVLLILGGFSRPAALIAFGFLTGLWVSEWGLGWIWELLVPMIVAAGLALGPSGQRAGVDAALLRRWPWLPI